LSTRHGTDAAVAHHSPHPFGRPAPLSAPHAVIDDPGADRLRADVVDHPPPAAGAASLRHRAAQTAPPTSGPPARAGAGAAVMEVLIVGAGVVGCAVAWRLQQAGVQCTVLERSIPGAEASSAAAGILAPQAEADGPGPFLGLCLRDRPR